MSFRVLIIALLFTATAGCVTPPAGMQPIVDTEAVHYVDAALGPQLRPVRTLRGRQGDLLRAQVHLRNPAPLAVAYRYRFLWFDVYDLEVTPREPWQRALLSGQGDMSVAGVAPSARATRFELWLQPN